MKNKTLDYYNHHAQSFISTTVSVNFKPVQDKFIHALNGPKVLDFGCGSGRDAKYFLESGLQVTAVDGSEEMCRYASEFTGIQVQNMLFQDLDAQNQYDGIWACSSILHLPKNELHVVLSKMVDALRDDGIIYTSFKYGDFEGERNGRSVSYTHLCMGIFISVQLLTVLLFRASTQSARLSWRCSWCALNSS